jgi:tungstate transport system ATP-binding protein
VYAVDGVRLIDIPNLRIEARGCTAIMGYNGAGKSMLLRLLHGLITPTSGVIEWAAQLPACELSRRQSMVFQTPELLRRSDAANIRYALARRGYRADARRARLEAVLRETNLLALRDRAASKLSGVERQRTALARALAPEPDMIFLDEPTASLDPAATIIIEQILQRAALAGRKLVVVTQSIGQAERLADDVIFLHHGRVTEHTPITEFLRSPRSAAGAAFIARRLLA